MNKTVLFSAVMGLFSLGLVSAANAECKAGEQRTLQTKVTRACKARGVSYSCARGATTAPIINKRITAGKACLAARQGVQKCFDSIDEGHQTAIDNVKKAISTCEGKLKNVGKGGPRGGAKGGKGGTGGKTQSKE